MCGLREAGPALGRIDLAAEGPASLADPRACARQLVRRSGGDAYGAAFLWFHCIFPSSDHLIVWM